MRKWIDWAAAATAAISAAIWFSGDSYLPDASAGVGWAIAAWYFFLSANGRVRP